ncbi:DNA repair protein RecO [Chloroflexales bacterium ZM16-3]|nr:DNA repair protein RecO [Chloroflexales bacterium ZM16-3]
MRERVYRTEAVILRRSDFAEADRLLLIATPAGKSRVVAKGVRKTTSRIAGHIELFTYDSMLLAVGRNLDIITQSQAINSFARMHAEIVRLSCAYYVAELYDKLTEEGEENRPLFQLLVDTFMAIDQSANPSLVLRAYELRLLHIAGYRPHLHNCAVCGELLAEDADRFSPQLGGVICPRDRKADQRAMAMSSPAFRLLRYLQSQPMSAVEALHLSATVRGEAESLMRAYLHNLLERELKSVAFLQDVMRGE